MSTYGLPEERDPDKDTHTDDVDLSAISRSGITQTQQTPSRPLTAVDLEGGLEAHIILIAHPEGRMLGTRFRVRAGEGLEIGRSTGISVSLPDVLSVSRRHARLVYDNRQVMLEDLGSTNGTYLNGRKVHDAERLRSGDRFQVGAAHFKFLHEQDVEHAYYEAIYDLVTRDGLTDVHNRRKYEEDMAREFARARRHERPLSLLLVDLDEFKDINDRCGHLCGDFVLKRFAVVIGEILRPEQTFARMGGDEFAILSPETDLAGARDLAERVRRRVAGLDYRYAGEPVPITCSVGVATLDRAMGRPDDLFEAADRAMYRSKQEGGDRVTLADREGGGSVA
jgi:diguanylate cyclase (GGDEF)-like protein